MIRSLERLWRVAVEFRILGPTEVLDDGEPVPLPRGRGRVLLGLLLLKAGEVVSTDRLIDGLWGETPPPTADTALQGLVSKLRRRLEPRRVRGEPPAVLVTRHPGYLLAAARTQIDAYRFRRLVADAQKAGPDEAADLLRTALSLWRGPALADFVYEPFAQSEIAELEELRLTAVEKRIEADLALGRHREVIGELEALSAEHPMRESVRGLLMLALYRSGRQAEALRVYAAIRRTMVEELGLDPGPSLQRLEQQILRQDPILDLDLGPASVAVGDEKRWLAEERKTVTVLSAAVGLSIIGAGDPDAETARRVFERFFDRAIAVVTGHGGTVERVIGDAVVGIFGVPAVREDDALRAVRAAVDLRHLVAALGQELAPDLRLTGRTGVDTGEVVVGASASDITGSPVRGSSRLQQGAAEGEILVGEATRLLVGRAVLAEPLGTEAVAGYHRPAWRVLDLVPGAPVFPLRAEAPMVDRDDELEELRAAYRRAEQAGRPHRLTVLGEPGIGKSRLGREVASRLSPEVRVLIGHCVGYGEGATFGPLREIVIAAAGRVEPGALLDLMGDEDDAASITEHVMAAVGSARSPHPPGATFPMLRRFFECLARRQPVVVILEDIHWAQPTLLDLVEYLTESARGALYLLCLARPELLDSRPGWLEAPHATSLVLRPLAPEHSRQLATSRVAGRMVPRGVVDRVVDTARGNPLFVEQLLAAVGEEGDLLIPATIQALLAARIDRLGPAERDVLRCASVLGHRFSMAALTALLPNQVRHHVSKHLRMLERKELLLSSAPSSSDELGFRHVLVQQAAYRTLTKQTRAELHERAAEWLEVAGHRDELEETAGHHLEHAYRYRRELGEVDAGTRALAVRAGEKLGGAGLRAFGRFDAAGAESLLARARSLLPGDHPDRWQVSFRLAEAYETMGKHRDADTVLTDLLTTEPEDTDTRLVLELERARVRLATGPDPVPLDEIADLAGSALAQARTAGDEARLACALFVLAEIFLRTGRMAEAEETARRGLLHADRSDSAREQLGARRMLATVIEGGPAPVADCIGECEELAMWRGMENPAVLPILARLRSMVEDFDGGRRLIARAETLLTEMTRARRPLVLLRKRHAEVEMLAGDLDAAAHELGRALQLGLDMETREEAAQVAALLSRVLFRTGRADEVADMARLSESLAPSESVGAQALWRSALALSMVAGGEAEAAGRLGEAAIELAPPAMLALRADLHVDLARVLAAAGRLEAARGALGGAMDLYRRKGDQAAVRLLATDDGLLGGMSASASDPGTIRRLSS